MFQPKARRIVLPVLALTAALCLAPLSDASARSRTAKIKPRPGGVSLFMQLEAHFTSFWQTLQSIWSDAGVRMDDNG